MPMMQVGVMRVPMHQGRMPVPMRVRPIGWQAQVMLMLVVRVMAVPMFVFHCFVDVLVVVAFREVKPEAKSHQSTRYQQQHGRWLAEHENGENRPYKRGKRKIGSGASGAEIAQAQHE
jgi:hypothetical protein